MKHHPVRLPILLRISGLLTGVILAMAPATHASTFEYHGDVVKVDNPTAKNPRTRDQALGSLWVFSRFVCYQSNTIYTTGEINDNNVLKNAPDSHKSHNSSTSINGRLVSPETFMRAARADLGKHAYVYQDFHFDMFITPNFEFGLLRGAAEDGSEVEIEVVQTNRSFHYCENPEFRRRVKIQPEAQVFLEEVGPEQRGVLARHLGKWIQIHPARKAIFWVETEASHWDQSRLPTPEGNASRGGPNSFTGNAIFKRWHVLGQDKEWILDTMRAGEWKEDLPVPLQRGRKMLLGAKLDGKAVPPWVAMRPGRHLVSTHYRREKAPHQMLFRTLDDERRGRITSASGDRVDWEQVHWDGRRESGRLTVANDAVVVLDGSPSTAAEAFQAGRFLRVFPAREAQRVVLLKEYQPFEPEEEKVEARPGLWRPNAYFKASTLKADQAVTVELDASFTHPSLGAEIQSYQWRFGDGSTAEGVRVSKRVEPKQGFTKMPVVLQVTDRDGHVGQWVETIDVTDGKLPSIRVDVGRLKPGVLGQSWFKGTLETAEADMKKTPDDTVLMPLLGDSPGNGRGKHLLRLQGYFEVPEDGWYTLRSHGTGFGSLKIGEATVIDTATTPGYGPFYEGPYARRAHVRLEKGWHAYDLLFYGQPGQARITIEGGDMPNVENPHGWIRSFVDASVVGDLPLQEINRNTARMQEVIGRTAPQMKKLRDQFNLSPPPLPRK